MRQTAEPLSLNSSTTARGRIEAGVIEGDARPLFMRLRRRLIRLVGRLWDIHARKSYSQEGEDMILARIFEGQRKGFYVDVGAHHPRRYSNTNLFYRRGWRGINVEPNPDAMRAFKSIRPRDINLQVGVSDRAGSLKYYLFDEPALNTFDEDIVASRLANTPYKLVASVEVPVERLDTLLSRHLPPDQEIDFLSVDVEGLDLAVLRSNDWARFRPRCVLVEALGVSLGDVQSGEIYSLLAGNGYELIAKTFNTLVFRQRA
jgi:FkbM family methyltransferase